MTGSYADAEDLVQETFLRAWRGRGGYEGRASLRAWLYRIATNACLDVRKSSARRTVPAGALGDPLAERGGLQPYPEARLEAARRRLGPPDEAVVARETVELGFVAALAHLPPRQRAVLIVRDVLGWTATEAAEALGTSEAAANSLLQRGRATLRRRAPRDQLEWSRPPLTAADEEALRRYIDAHHRADAEAIVAMLRADARLTMPPEPPCSGRAAAAAFFGELLGPDGPGTWRMVATAANGRPAAANYLRRPGDDAFRALSIDVLRLEGGELVEVNCFLVPSLFPAFGLPAVHPGP